MTRVLAFLIATAALAQGPLVTNIGNFIHNVSDVERSARFYRDVIGMDMPRPAGDWQTTEGVIKMYDAIGGRFRVANAQIPGSPMRAELAEFQGVEKQPVSRPWGVTGNSVLMLTVNDLAPIQERVKSENATMLVAPQQACDGRGFVVADPDGFAVALIQRNAVPAADAKSNFTGMKFGYLVNGDALARAIAALGLKAEVRTHVCAPIEEVLLGGASSVVTLPTGFEVWLIQGKPAGAHAPVRPRDPGAAVLRFAVSNTDAAVQALQQAGLSVASAGGEIQTLAPGTARAAILRAPDDLLIQVVK